jgi:NOL1/NOP2/sun family putative RNA methylase
MSGRDFFIQRYRQLGWEYGDVASRQAIRISVSNSKDPFSVVERLRDLGVTLRKIPFLQHGFWVDRARFSVGATSEYLSGLYSIQEGAAQLPVTVFTGLQNKSVLDACAAPGGKTTQLADLMCNSGVVVALDIDNRRLVALANQLERCRVKNVVVYKKDARKICRLKMLYDHILLDLPCSGNFVTDKGWFARRTLRDVKRNALLQRRILAATVKTLRDGGEIVYSTCSLEPEEDELNIDWAIRNLNLSVVDVDCYGSEGVIGVFGSRLDGSIRKCRRIWPGKTQGFFLCKLRKKETT